MKIAVVTVGDRDAEYKGIVTLNSMKRFNPEFDYFLLALQPSSPAPNYLKILEKYGIGFINTNSQMLEYINSFNNYQYYPRVVFLKHYLPVYFNYFDYDYLVVTDYDILCINKWNINDILPEKEVVANWQFGNLKTYVIPEHACHLFPLFGEDLEILANNFVPNVGFMIYNIKKYCEKNLYLEWPKLFNTLKQEWFAHVLDEICAGLFMVLHKIPVKKLASDYNLTSFWHKFKKEAYNIHFNYPVKLWNFEESLKKRFIPQDQIKNFIQHSNLLIEYYDNISQYEFADKIVHRDVKNIMPQLIINKFFNHDNINNE